MTNAAPRNYVGLEQMLDLARADEREKMTDEKVKEYFAGLNGKETALVVLNYLLRGGITDDDLRGLRLQWIKEQPEKNNFYCADWNRCGTTCEEQCAACAKTDNLEQPEGVDVWVSWDTEDEGVESNPCLTDSKPEKVSYCGRNYFDLVKCDLVVELSEGFAEYFGVHQGECKAFEIRECES